VLLLLLLWWLWLPLPLLTTTAECACVRISLCRCSLFLLLAPFTSLSLSLCLSWPHLRTGPELMVVSHALYTIWLLTELLADRLPPPLGSHKRTAAGGGVPRVPLVPPSPPRPSLAEPRRGGTSADGGASGGESGGGGAMAERGERAEEGEEGEEAELVAAAPTWGPGSAWALGAEEPLHALFTDDSFAAVAYCSAALAVQSRFDAALLAGARDGLVPAASLTPLAVFGLLPVLWYTRLEPTHACAGPVLFRGASGARFGTTLGGDARR
jgi:hypothetical protein